MNTYIIFLDFERSEEASGFTVMFAYLFLFFILCPVKYISTGRSASILTYSILTNWMKMVL